MIQFPGNFFWGAATSAYQVEGGNQNCDWWQWERKVGLKEACGYACRHYEFYRQDFDLAKQLHHNAHRLSIEWSRIEPKKDQFSSQELGHYKDVILSLKERNLEPIVTLHHFTNPLWFTGLGSWQNKDCVEYFLQYVNRIVEELCDQVRFWITINEPMVFAYHAYVLGIWPPQETSLSKSKNVVDNLISAHVKAYQAIHTIYKKKKIKAPFVSIAKNMQPFIPCIPNLKNKLAAYLRSKFFNFDPLERLIRHRSLDFIGLNYYTRGLVDVEKWRLRNLLLDTCKKNHSSLKKNSLGWDIYPEGLYLLLSRLKKYNLPVFILENGICTQDDNLRWEFIAEHLKNIYLAINKGIEILGYIHWSLMDNFEWDKGFAPRFGLINVDYNTFERSIRDSARNFAIVCKTGRLN